MGLTDIGGVLAPGLLELARVAQADVVARLKANLWATYPEQLDESPTRITGYFEEGLSLLYRLAEHGDLPASEVEECRWLAERDPRYHFVYRLPMSAGFGIAIGRALQRALTRNDTELMRETTALLNVFMTALDGVLDEVPEAIEPHWDKLLRVVQGERSSPSGKVDNPVVSLCFRVAELWRDRVAQASEILPDSLMVTFDNAVRESMSAEYRASKSHFFDGIPVSDEYLFGRTRWPHWTQAVACLLPHGVPSSLELGTYQQMIFRIGDYAAVLDDISDYVDDCIAERWNTIFYAIVRERAYRAESPDRLKQRLLVALSNDVIGDSMVAMALKTRADLERSIDATGLLRDNLLPLIADLSYAYVGYTR